MSNVTRSNNSYALNQPINLDAPYPIVAKRAPTGADKAPIGQEWVVPAANAVYFLSSIVNNVANWVNIAGGSGTFTSLTINPGPLNLTGTFNQTGNYNLTGNIVQTGNIGLTGNFTGTGAFQNTGAFTVIAGTNAVQIGNDAAAHNTTLGSATGNSATTINAGTGNLTLNAATGGSILLQSADANIGASESTISEASPTATATINARVGRAVFTGFTTAAAGSQSFTIDNSLVTTSSLILVTVTNTGANDAQMTLTRVLLGASQFQVDTINNGAQALNGDLQICFWVVN